MPVKPSDVGGDYSKAAVVEWMETIDQTLKNSPVGKTDFWFSVPAQMEDEDIKWVVLQYKKQGWDGAYSKDDRQQGRKLFLSPFVNDKMGYER